MVGKQLSGTRGKCYGRELSTASLRGIAPETLERSSAGWDPFCRFGLQRLFAFWNPPGSQLVLHGRKEFCPNRYCGLLVSRKKKNKKNTRAVTHVFWKASKHTQSTNNSFAFFSLSLSQVDATNVEQVFDHGCV